MKPVRYRDGFDGRGGRDARYLDDNNRVSFLKIRRPALGDRPAIVSSKKGEFLEVRRDDVAVDGFYSTGLLVGDTVKTVFASSSGRGVFALRGAPTIDGASLFLWGNGFAAGLKAVVDGYYLNFDSHATLTYTVQAYRSRNGRTLQDNFAFSASGPFDGAGGYAAAFSVLAGAWVADGTAYKFRAGVGFMRLIAGGQMVLSYVVDDGNAQTLGATGYLPNQLAWYPELQRLGPSTVLMVNKYLRNTWYGPSVLDNAACPGVFYTLSRDAGLTWAAVSSEAIISEFVATRALPILDSWFNDYVAGLVLSAAPLSATRALLYMVVPYGTDGTIAGNYKAKVKLGIIDTALGGAMLGTLTLFTGSLDEALTFHSGAAAKFGAFNAALAVRGGALVFSNPITGANDEWNQRRRIQFTADGVSLVDVGLMPLPNYQTGVVVALSPDVLVCPMYDGQHALYQSADRGATWTRRAIITANGQAPDPARREQSLQNFGQLIYLRRDGKPTNATPGAPWVSDARIAAPT